ncbi:MAG: PorT family protein [Bacteroidales bacterium]|nr:PorT family protein [Bacteroidales bacterium]
MKKLSILITSLFIVGFSFGQEKQEKFSGGIYFSPEISWFKPDNKQIKSEKSRLSFGFGITSDIALTNAFSLNLGLGFFNAGGSLKYLDSLPKIEAVDSTYKMPANSIIKYKLQYIELPLSIKGKTKEIGYISYFLKFGFSPLLRYKARADITVDSNDDVKNEVRAVAFAYHVGAGITYSLKGNTKLLFEGVFRNGLSDIEKIKNYKNKDYKNILNVIEIRAGIVF